MRITFPTLCAFCLAAALAGGRARAAAPGFARKPSARRVNGKSLIEFAASAKTDCAVYVLDSRGKVVRHLAAGVLGDKAPPPLGKGLAQKITWDGRDDRGKPASGGPFKVRVALGLRPTFERMIGYNPAALGSVRALAVGPKGEVFVFHVFGGLHPNDGTVVCSVFDRRGKYLRQILPYPANLPEEKLKGLKRIALNDGKRAPFIYQAETRSLVPGAGDLPPHRAVVTRDGRVAFAGVLESPKRYAQAGPERLVVVVNADGSVPPDGVLKALITKHGNGSAQLALSPDEKTVYASGVRQGSYGGKPDHTVYKLAWTDARAKRFAGGSSASGGGALKDPRGVAVDKSGNVYVADRGNDRVAVFKPDGSLLGALKVEKPLQVEVHPASGAVYVLGGARSDQLRKYASWKAKAPAAETALPSFKHKRYTVTMALDASAPEPLLYFGTPFGYYAKFSLLRIADKGGSFGEKVDIAKLPQNRKPGAGSVTTLGLNPGRELLYVNGRTYDLRKNRFTGRKASRKLVGDFGRDGKVYGQFYPRSVARYDADLKPLPFAKGTGKNGHIPGLAGTMRLRGRGVTADHLGNVYALWETRDKATAKAVGGRWPNPLYKYAPDGSLLKAKLLDIHFRCVSSPRVDYQGNIYLLAGLRPGAAKLPPGLKGKVPDTKRHPDAVGGLNPYPLIYGSVVKFGPEGGGILKEGGVACNFAFGNPITVKGAKWIFPGASNVPSWRTKGNPDICLCESLRFDVDGFGRSFFPDAGRFRVGVIDTGGNQICWFGSYGNQDSAGPGSKVPVPALPFYWPHAVAAGAEAVYIGDRMNRRVVAVKLAYAAEETCAIR